MFKRIISGILLVVMLFSQIQVKAFAKEDTTDYEELKDTVFSVVSLLKEVFDARYDETEEELEDLIIANDYDYSLSMDTFYNQPNPLKDAECIKYLSAYMSCKKYAKENSIAISQLREIPFIEYEIEEKETEEYIPTAIDKYVLSSDSEDEYFICGTEYILSPTEIPVYESVGNGRYIKTDETTSIEPDVKTVKYADIKLSVIGPEDVFEYLGIDEDLVKKDYEKRCAKIEEIVTDRAIAETITVNMPDIDLLETNNLLEYASMLEGIDSTRKTVIQTALSLKDKVPYEWGGKPDGPGFDSSWWTYDTETGLQKGLDCSGFVQWVFMTAGFSNEIYDNLTSTSTLLESSLTKIKREELKPGDIGVTARPNGEVNHVAIYLGNDEWIHCSSSKKTVTVSELSLSVFYSPYEDAKEIDQSVADEYVKEINQDNETIINSDNITNNIDSYNSLYYTQNYNNDDVMLLAQLIYHEANSEGVNGWIGVGEVVVNRINSSAFPNNVHDVVYQKGQFSGNDELAYITPTDEMLSVAQMVLSGEMKVLNNENVLYFRNPWITDHVPAATPMDWGSLKWFTAINNHAFYLQQ